MLDPEIKSDVKECTLFSIVVHGCWWEDTTRDVRTCPMFVTCLTFNVQHVSDVRTCHTFSVRRSHVSDVQTFRRSWSGDTSFAMTSRPSTSYSSKTTTENDDLWSTMLNSVSSSQRLPTKNIIVLGGGANGCKDFVDSLWSSIGGKRGRRMEDIADKLAMGFTYFDIEDNEHDELLARLGLYTMPTFNESYTALVGSILNAASLPHCVVCVLLDWEHPWTWARELRTWMRMVKKVVGVARQGSREADAAVMSNIEQCL
ncbi:Cytoplasmic dynein 1 light intermediate chain 2 [Neolecta irregularis DAH-3]|uniref:Cytoplasmic dynein 1 light intermediate chain 2 n=1 Tax=Neolecta irregularis (strain DAH-3) TaxID=1198029 RepID=A0A1U7LMY2_NEOID|nr:Cytoplasmic dynein 1 light intermediate chain 2 [Neolecta irregularis DAH-3]|eukprot:OLL23943.1 Cytoplasmic dynein 1 light intermediate chain 2 [Neolecta irregularis DAH-3]